MPTRTPTRPLRARALALAAVGLALWPAAAAAWGPARSGGFGPSVMRGGAGADFLRGPRARTASTAAAATTC